jgi:hypothetical protein
MLLQVTGRLDPGEIYANFNLDAGSILPKGPYVTLELVNIIICKQENHDHFPKADVSAYPVDAARYPESITVRQSRPRPLTFRRRTTLHVPQLEMPAALVDEDGENEEEEATFVNRFRREIGESGVAEEEEDDELGDMEFMYAASFRDSIFEFEIANFPQLALDGLVNGVLQGKQAPASYSHFQRLLHHQPQYEFVEPSETSEEKGRKKRVKITLPPLTRLMCARRDFFGYLGMHDLAEKIGETELFGLSNESSSESKAFFSTDPQPTSLKFNFYDREVKPLENYTLFLQRLNPFVLSKVSLSNFCNKNSFATSKFFQMTLNCVVEALDLPEHCLKAFLLNDETTLELDKSENLLHAEDAVNNFKVRFKFGLRLRDLLGLEQDEIVWILTPRRPGQIKLTQALIPEAAEICEKIMTEMIDDFYNQTSSNPTVKEWKKQYEERKQRKTTEKTFDVGGSEFDFDIEGRQVDDDDEGDFVSVQIPNPFPRPPTSFTVANSKRKHICTPPNIFPEYFTLILREGEPIDYLTSVRGHGSVLGIVRKMQPNIVANTCVVKNVATLKSLSIEIVDVSLNTIKVALESPPVWIKLDLKCHSGQQY